MSPARCVLFAGTFTPRVRVQWLILKGTVTRDFLLQIFFMNHLSPSPWGKLIHVENLKTKISWHSLFKQLLHFLFKKMFILLCMTSGFLKGKVACVWLLTMHTRTLLKISL